MNRKRGQNEGSSFQRKDGRWCGILNLGWEDGRRKRKYLYGATAAEVQDQLLKARSDHSRGLPVAVERQTVAEFLDHWLENTLKPKAKPRSYESFSTIVRLHAVPTIGGIRLDKLSPQHIQGLVNNKLMSGLSPQTVVNIRTVLRSALGEALKWGLVARNVASLVDPPRIPRPKNHALTGDEARRLLEAARGERFEAIYVFALNLGMRRGEILGLRWSDVDFEGRALRIGQAMQRLESGLQITEVKTERSRRMIAMPESVIRALRSRRARQAQERLVAGRCWQETGLVFTNGSGGPLEPITLHRHYKHLLSRARVSTATRFHDLRHSTASLLLAQGVHLRVIMELLGHSSISLTANTYSHVMPAAMRDVADTMDAILGSANKT
jgi:integrase